jgi:hypothetical protein
VIARCRSGGYIGTRIDFGSTTDSRTTPPSKHNRSSINEIPSPKGWTFVHCPV